MARKTTLKENCPFCGEQAVETGRMEFGNEWLIALLCGHTIAKPMLQTDEGVWIESSDGRALFPFQKLGVEFFETPECDCNGLLLDEQGLGKTVQIAALLARNKENLLPCLAVVKSGLRAQIFAEIFRWAGIASQLVTSSKEQPYTDIFPVTIVSVDTLRLLRPDVKIVTEYDKAQAQALNKRLPDNTPKWTDETCAQYRFIWIDESQKIKNPGSARTQALRLMAQARMKVKGEKPRIICTSGTNIEKHAGEYFVTLNLVRPDLFPQQSMFQLAHCEVNPETGKIMGLKNPERFRELTKDFIIRRKRIDVLPELPKVFRQFRLAELEGDFLDSYVKIVKDFQEAMDDPEKPMLPTDILGYLSKMRHLTGIAKCDAAVEYIEEFLFECERKLVVFVHHKMAGAIIMKKLEKILAEGAFAKPLQLHSELTLEERTQVVEEFKKPENRILVASTLAAGEGLNMQFCSDCLIMERQWNPSIEEQAEGRFPRPGSVADKINAVYLIAAGTIDDFLTTMVETKRRNVAQTLDGQEIVWEESSLINELAKALQTKGLAKWKLS